MRTSLMDFTRGSQIAETVTMMFGTAIRPMLYTAAAIVIGSVAWRVWGETETGDSYFWIMHLYASAWKWMAFSPHKLIGLKTLTQGTVQVHIADVTTYPPLQQAWLRLWSAVTAGVMFGLLAGLPMAIGSTILLRRFGHNLTQRKHKRGSQLVTAPALKLEVDAYNNEVGKPERVADLRRILGPGAWHRAPFATRTELLAAGMYEPYLIAGIPYPWRSEQTHTLLVGTTGTGKSTVMKNLLAQIRARRGRAIVFDLTGTYVESFYNPSTDTILNPFDARCPQWSPFSDAHTREHFKEASLALIPIADGGGEQFWPESARMLFVETCVRLVEQGRGTAQALSDVLMTSKLKELHAHVLRTVAAPLTDPEAKRMAESIRATFNTYAQALHTLPQTGPAFSVRDWVLASETDVDDPVKGQQREGSVLFIAAQHVNLRSVRVLLTLWLTTAINTLMSMTGDQRDIRLWILLDEVNALHNIPALISGMQTARNYGGAFVLGVHTMHQLKETYGDNLAETIASLAKTKLMMATKDKATQEWESAQVGEGEWSEMEENLSYGVSNIRDAATLQRKVKLEPLVLFSEFNELRNLTGYLKFPEGLPAALVKLSYVKFNKPNRGFIEREIAPLAPPQPVLALPYYVTKDGTRVTADGEIIETPPSVSAAPPGEAPVDPSGEGFQTTTTATGAPERSVVDVRLAEAAAREWVRDHGDAGRLNIVLDPRLNVPVKTGGGDNSAAKTAGERERGTNADRPDGQAREKGATSDGLAVQEQRQYLGEAASRDAAKELHRQRAAGNNVPAHAVPALDQGIENDSDWGRGA